MPTVIHYVACKWCGERFYLNEAYSNDMWHNELDAWNRCFRHEEKCSQNPNSERFRQNTGWTHEGPSLEVRWTKTE